MGQGHDLNFFPEKYLQILSKSDWSLTGMGEQSDGGVLTRDLSSIFWNSSGLFWMQIYLPEPKLKRGLNPFLLSLDSSPQFPFFKVIVVSRSRSETKTAMLFWRGNLSAKSEYLGACFKDEKFSLFFKKTSNYYGTVIAGKWHLYLYRVDIIS